MNRSKRSRDTSSEASPNIKISRGGGGGGGVGGSVAGNSNIDDSEAASSNYDFSEDGGRSEGASSKRTAASHATSKRTAGGGSKRILKADRLVADGDFLSPTMGTSYGKGGGVLTGSSVGGGGSRTTRGTTLGGHSSKQLRKVRAKQMYEQATTVYEAAGTFRTEMEELVECFRDDTIFRETTNTYDDENPFGDDGEDGDGETVDNTDPETDSVHTRSTRHTKRKNSNGNKNLFDDASSSSDGGGGASSRAPTTAYESTKGGATTVRTGATGRARALQGSRLEDGRHPLGFYACTACDHKFTEPTQEDLTMEQLRDIYHHCGSSKHRTRLQQLFSGSKRLRDEKLDPKGYICIHINGVPCLVSKDLGGSTHFSIGRSNLTHGARDDGTGFEGRATDLLDLGSSMFYPVEQFQTEYRLQAQSRRPDAAPEIVRQRAEFARAVKPADINPLELEFVESRPESGGGSTRNFGGSNQHDLTTQLNAFSKLGASKKMVGLETRMRFRRVKWGNAETKEQIDEQSFEEYKKEKEEGRKGRRGGGGGGDQPVGERTLKIVSAVKPEFCCSQKSNNISSTSASAITTTRTVKVEPSATQGEEGGGEDEEQEEEEEVLAHLQEDVLMKSAEFPASISNKMKDKMNSVDPVTGRTNKKLTKAEVEKRKKRMRLRSEKEGILFEIPRDLSAGKHPSARLRIDGQSTDEVLSQYTQHGGNSKADPLIILEEGETDKGKPFTVIDLTHTIKAAPEFTFDPALSQSQQRQQSMKVVKFENGEELTEKFDITAATAADGRKKCPELDNRVSVQEGDNFRLSWYIRGFREVKKPAAGVVKFEKTGGSSNDLLGTATQDSIHPLRAHMQREDTLQQQRHRGSHGGATTGVDSSYRGTHTGGLNGGRGPSTTGGGRKSSGRNSGGGGSRRSGGTALQMDESFLGAVPDASPIRGSVGNDSSLLHDDSFQVRGWLQTQTQ